MEGALNLWFDEEGDFLEFSIDKRKGYFKDIGNDTFERLDDETGEVIGFGILNFRKRFEKTKEEIKLPIKIKVIDSK